MRVRVKLGSDRVGGDAASRCAHRPSMFREEPTWVEGRPSRRKGSGPLQSGSVGRPDVRRANNLKLRGGGLHHVAIEAADFDRSLRFYTEGLGFRNVLTFPEEGQTVAMLDTGDATYVELFSGGSGKRPSGSILHLALRTSDCDKATERARTAGGTITQEPTDVVLEGDPPVPVRYSFCEGPDGEQIELFQAEAL
jgi:glyoxylase I family protein